ncbi:MAG: hypothetical protein ACRDGA_03790, partial [Bacteroidota bacterium]
MKTIIRGIFLLHFLFTAGVSTMFGQQSDTSSYFPLGLWGIWIDHSRPPFSGTANWTLEQQNWRDVKGNYLVFWIPYWVEGTVMDFADQNNYKMDIANYNYWYPSGVGNENSLYYWINAVGMSDTMRAITLIDSLKTVWGNRQGWYNYTFDQERPVSNSDFWPRVQFLARKIRELNPARKSYMVSGGAPSQEFIDATPSLDILQMDVYFFRETVGRNYADQQAAFDNYSAHYDATMNRLRGKHTEWQVIIQSQREYFESGSHLRRPNFYELRAQAYLGLSRGARGVTSYVYGTFPLQGQSGTQSTTSSSVINQGLLHGTSTSSLLASIGLADPDRFPYTAQSDPDNIDAFQNVSTLYDELRPIGSAFRKLRHYQAFHNAAVPSNSANIFSVSGDKIEIGTFKRMDQGTDSTNYFILVNRVCNNSDGSVSSPQNVSVVVTNGKYFIQDQRTKAISVGTYDGGTNRTTFSITLAPGEGKLFLLKKVREGTIASNQTWRDVEVVASNVTVNSGVTLTVLPGTIVNFTGNYKLRVEGTLSANGTSENPIAFQGNGTPGFWFGIEFYNAPSNQSLAYCAIKDANNGLNLINSDIDVFLLTLTNNINGVTCTNASDPTLNSTVFQENNFGVNGDGTSVPSLTIFGGYNSFRTNQMFDVYSTYSGTIYARGNWWGICPPSPSVTFNVDYSEWLCSDPNPKLSQPVVTVPISLSGVSSASLTASPSVKNSASPGDPALGRDPEMADVDAAYQLYLAGEYQEALQAFEALVANYPETFAGRRALVFVEKALVKL